MAARAIGRIEGRTAGARAEVWSGATVGNPDWSRVAPTSLNMSTYKRAAYDTLADMIAQFELPPGERLVESELARRLGVSKTPIREALAMLEAQGLVETSPYRGAKVRWLRRVEMEEQGFLIDALEEPAYTLVIARITKIEMAAVGRIMEQLKRARRRNDGLSFGRLTTEFHTGLFRTTGYPRLEQLLAMIVGPVALRYDRLLIYQFDDAWDTQLKLMEGRYEALRDGNADRAIEVVRRYRAQLRQMGENRLADPEIARYFED